jgi:hypothetical protein
MCRASSIYETISDVTLHLRGTWLATAVIHCDQPQPLTQQAKSAVVPRQAV